MIATTNKFSNKILSHSYKKKGTAFFGMQKKNNSHKF